MGASLVNLNASSSNPNNRSNPTILTSLIPTSSNNLIKPQASLNNLSSPSNPGLSDQYYMGAGKTDDPSLRHAANPNDPNMFINLSK